MANLRNFLNCINWILGSVAFCTGFKIKLVPKTGFGLDFLCLSIFENIIHFFAMPDFYYIN